jgi:hypothetical protein
LRNLLNEVEIVSAGLEYKALADQLSGNDLLFVIGFICLIEDKFTRLLSFLELFLDCFGVLRLVLLFLAISC